MSARRSSRQASSVFVETSGGKKNLTSSVRGAAYFLAVQSGDLHPNTLPYLQDEWVLIALNFLLRGREIAEEQLQHIQSLVDNNKKLFLDSGCFSLACAEAKNLNCSPADVFMYHPSELPFFESWYNTYITTVPTVIDNLWGVVEIDFGTPEDRANTRARIFNDCGVHPIPVFRFGKDPVSLFEELVSTHDRVCLGGLAKASGAVRYMSIPLLREIQHRANPDCWIHCLGMAGSGPFASSGFSSCDASSYSNSARYGATNGYTNQGYTSVAEWTKVPPRVKDLDDGTSTQFVRKLGLFQHSVMNLGRVSHLQELDRQVRI